MIDIHTIGAGGGCIARVTAGGMLQVGRRARAPIPGPVCYGRGGKEPTSPTRTWCSAGSTRPALLGVDGAADLDAVRRDLDAKSARLSA